jgi:hypothetical protein
VCFIAGVAVHYLFNDCVNSSQVVTQVVCLQLPQLHQAEALPLNVATLSRLYNAQKAGGDVDDDEGSPAEVTGGSCDNGSGVAAVAVGFAPSTWRHDLEVALAAAERGHISPIWKLLLQHHTSLMDRPLPLPPEAQQQVAALASQALTCCAAALRVAGGTRDSDMVDGVMRVATAALHAVQSYCALDAAGEQPIHALTPSAQKWMSIVVFLCGVLSPPCCAAGQEDPGRSHAPSHPAELITHARASLDAGTRNSRLDTHTPQPYLILQMLCGWSTPSAPWTRRSSCACACVLPPHCCPRAMMLGPYCR